MFRSAFTFARNSLTHRFNSRFFRLSIDIVRRGHSYVQIIPRSATLAAVFGFSLKAKSIGDELRQVTEKADKLFDESNFPELLALLTQQESWYNEHELLWRVARCKYHLSKKDPKNKGQLLRDSLSHVERALEINNKCGPAHKVSEFIRDQA